MNERRRSGGAASVLVGGAVSVLVGGAASVLVGGSIEPSRVRRARASGVFGAHPTRLLLLIGRPSSGRGVTGCSRLARVGAPFGRGLIAVLPTGARLVRVERARLSRWGLKHGVERRVLTRGRSRERRGRPRDGERRRRNRLQRRRRRRDGRRRGIAPEVPRPATLPRRRADIPQRGHAVVMRERWGKFQRVLRGRRAGNRGVSAGAGTGTAAQLVSRRDARPSSEHRAGFARATSHRAVPRRSFAVESPRSRISARGVNRGRCFVAPPPTRTDAAPRSAWCGRFPGRAESARNPPGTRDLYLCLRRARPERRGIDEGCAPLRLARRDARARRRRGLSRRGRYVTWRGAVGESQEKTFSCLFPSRPNSRRTRSLHPGSRRRREVEILQLDDR